MSRILNPLVAAPLLVLLLNASAWADESVGITAIHGKIYETQKADVQTQGFIEIDNSESTADTLTKIDCSIADTTSIVGPDGVAINNLTVAPGKNLILTANGPHILLRSTHFTIDQGGAIPCSLTFQNAGDISVYLYPIPAP